METINGQYRHLDCHSVGIHVLMGIVGERKGTVLVLQIRISKTLPVSQASRVRGRIARLCRPKKPGGKEKKSKKAHNTDHGQICNYSDTLSDYCHAVFWNSCIP